MQASQTPPALQTPRALQASQPLRTTQTSPTTPPSSSPPAAADRPPIPPGAGAQRPVPLRSTPGHPRNLGGDGRATGWAPHPHPLRPGGADGAGRTTGGASGSSPPRRPPARRLHRHLRQPHAQNGVLLRWATSRCPAVPFILKADDDVFVNLPALTSYLASFRRAPRLYLGRIHWWVRPQRDPRGRHHVPVAVYPAATFPLYCSGTAYVLSGEAAAAVLAAAPPSPFRHPRGRLGGPLRPTSRFGTPHSARMAGSARFPLDGCCYGEVLFSSHGLGPGELRRVWGLLRGEGGGCDTLQRALGVLRCKALAVGEWLWQ
ncbi:beta-1,3-galactosyltransferase 4 isoform 1-T3 [Morphnus guianensis]